MRRLVPYVSLEPAPCARSHSGSHLSGLIPAGSQKPKAHRGSVEA